MSSSEDVDRNQRGFKRDINEGLKGRIAQGTNINTD